MIVFWLVGGILVVTFGLIVFRGAPFVPTLSKDTEALFDAISVSPDECIVDLGSGDGRIVGAAAARGFNAVGYELNPLLALYSKFKLKQYGSKARVELKDFWVTPLPQNTAIVFVFLAGPFMRKLDSKLTQESVRLGRDIVLISYGVKMPQKNVEAVSGGFLTYRYSPNV